MLKHHPELKRLFRLSLIAARIAGKEKDGIIEIPAFPAFEKELCRVIKKDLTSSKKLCSGLKRDPRFKNLF